MQSMTDSSTARLPMTAERLRMLTQLALAEHEDIEAVRPTGSIYLDRLVLVVEDRSGLAWRLYVMRDAQAVVAR